MTVHVTANKSIEAFRSVLITSCTTRFSPCVKINWKQAENIVVQFPRWLCEFH